MRGRLLRIGRCILVLLSGLLVIAAGLAMLVLPGPGVVTILLGLGILSLEFERPRLWLARLKAKGARLKQRFEQRRSRSGDGR